MAITVAMEFTNLAKIKALLSQFGPKSTQMMARAMYETLTDVEADSKARYVPYRLGTLHDSIHVVPPKISGSQIETRIVAGGPAAPYAVIVHEDLRPKKWTKPGTGPKYIERPLMLAFRTLQQQLVTALRRAAEEMR